jgi:hypothetical protein
LSESLTCPPLYRDATMVASVSRRRHPIQDGDIFFAAPTDVRPLRAIAFSAAGGLTGKFVPRSSASEGTGSTFSGQMRRPCVRSCFSLARLLFQSELRIM